MFGDYKIRCKWVEVDTGEVHEMVVTLEEYNRICKWERDGIIVVLLPKI